MLTVSKTSFFDFIKFHKILKLFNLDLCQVGKFLSNPVLGLNSLLRCPSLKNKFINHNFS